MSPQAITTERSPLLQAFAETALIFALFFVLAGTPPPDVNEAHYLAKAKHYWNPEWCPRDHFLNTADAHQVFYWTFGWVTLFFNLPTVAWLGRCLTWWLMAWSWRRLSFALIPTPMFALFTAACFTTLLQWGHMAGEWVIGGVEAKGFAYALVWLALESLVRDRWRSAVLFLGASSAFHVLVGGWSIVALAIAWLLCRRDNRPQLRRLFPALIAGGLVASVGLIPALALSWSESDEIVQQANRIYVFERLPHHLVFHSLPHRYMVRHAGLLAIWLIILWWGRSREETAATGARRFHRFVAGAVAIAEAGVIVDQSLLYFRPLAASLLRYYWFRLSDVMIPAGVTFAASAWLAQLFRQRVPLFNWVLARSLAVLVGNVGYSLYEHMIDSRPGAVVQASPADGKSKEQLRASYDAWRDVCDWIETNTAADAVFLTPRHQQTFHWEANRSEVVSAKNVPQDARGIVEWRQRMNDIFPWSVRYADLTAHGEERLRELSEKYDFQFIIVDRSVSSSHLRFPRVYPPRQSGNDQYEVYRMP